MGKLGAYLYRVREGATLPQAFICPLALSAGAHSQSLRPLSRRLHIPSASLTLIQNWFPTPFARLNGKSFPAPWQPKLTEAKPSNNSWIEQFIASESERTT